MADNTGNAQFSLTYTDAFGVQQSLPSRDVLTAYGEGALSVSGLDVPDLAAADTEYEVAFSDVAIATYMLIENSTGQEILVHIGGDYVQGTLVSGTKTIAFPAVEGERLSVEMVTSGGTPGILSVRRSSGNVIVESWLAGTGLQASDTSVVRVFNNPALALPSGGLVSFALPSAPETGAPVASAQVTLTAAQDGAGVVATVICGDPTA